MELGGGEDTLFDKFEFTNNSEKLEIPEESLFASSSGSPSSSTIIISDSKECTQSQSPSERSSSNLAVECSEAASLTDQRTEIPSNLWTCDTPGCDRSFPQRHMLK
jgi:hypothetical protein